MTSSPDLPLCRAPHDARVQLSTWRREDAHLAAWLMQPVGRKILANEEHFRSGKWTDLPKASYMVRFLSIVAFKVYPVVVKQNLSFS